VARQQNRSIYANCGEAKFRDQEQDFHKPNLSDLEDQDLVHYIGEATITIGLSSLATAIIEISGVIITMKKKSSVQILLSKRKLEGINLTSYNQGRLRKK